MSSRNPPLTPAAGTTAYGIRPLYARLLVDKQFFDSARFQSVAILTQEAA